MDRPNQKPAPGIIVGIVGGSILLICALALIALLLWFRIGLTW